MKGRCENCGKAIVIEKRITRVYGRGRKMLMIENVPILVCPHCGASYLEAKTLQEIARIKLHRRALPSRSRLTSLLSLFSNSLLNEHNKR